MATAVVTGANRGIGLELARLLKERGDTVIAICRKSSKELDALDVQVLDGVDVTNAKSIESLPDRITSHVDLLVNNAGLLEHQSLGSIDYASVDRQFQVNAVGPLRVTEALLPRLGKGSKLALVTSRMGSIADNGSGGAYGYRMSKAALNAAGVSLARDLQSQGIAVVILHPGFVRTGMTGGNGNVEPDEAARGLLERIDELSLESSGKFFHANGEELPW